MIAAFGHSSLFVPLFRPAANSIAQPPSRVLPTRKRNEFRNNWSMSSAPEAGEGLKILTYSTSPIEGQATGTSGLRKKTKVLISNPKYLPNWIQSLFNALGGEKVLKGKTLILGGDGRFYNKVSAQTILRMAPASGIGHVVVGKNALLTTPAVSALIPAREAIGGLIMTASHNPAGIDGDWGIKYNTEAGAPALESLTSKIYEETQKISEYKLADFGADIDITSVGMSSYADGQFIVEVIDPVEEYIDMLKGIFDFDEIKSLIARDDFSFVFDAMHASTGEYATRLFIGILGADKNSIMNGIPLEDFGGGHPDPNLTYAAELVDILDPTKNPHAPQFGAASDGDGDRNMILGQGVFVNPGDSVAIIADYAEEAIPYFKERGLKGVARSMPTSSALDKVAEARGIPVYETPTGWKYFTNLMNAEKISICGEESFGTSSSHIREKDGLWAVMSWLSILAYKNRETKIGNLITVEDILLSHWRKYGRTYSMRYDYESISARDGETLMVNLQGMACSVIPTPEEVHEIDEFEYTDPIDGSVALKQGIRVVSSDGSRVVYRLSGTGSAGATVRVYFETYEEPTPDMENKDPRIVFEDLAQFAVQLARIKEMTGRDAPTVIT